MQCPRLICINYVATEHEGGRRPGYYKILQANKRMLKTTNTVPSPFAVLANSWLSGYINHSTYMVLTVASDPVQHQTLAIPFLQHVGHMRSCSDATTSTVCWFVHHIHAWNTQPLAVANSYSCLSAFQLQFMRNSAPRRER